MNRANLHAALFEARRFIRLAGELEKDQPEGGRFHSSPKQSGAVRRASMDLTRALAEMRKPS